MRRILGIFLCLVIWGVVVEACPICHTETGQQVRAGIFDESFSSNLLLILAPFLVLAVILLAMHFGTRLRRPWPHSNS